MSEFKLALQRFEADHRWLMGLSHACERFHEQLNGNERASGEQNEAMRVALESIDPDFDIEETGTVTLQALKTALKEAVRWAKEALRFVFETFNSVYIKFTGSVGKVRKIQQKLTQRYAKLGNRVTTSKMKVAGVQRLSINGEFVGSDLSGLQDIERITTYILEQYPRAIVSIARDTSRRFLNIVEHGQGKDPEALAKEGAAEFGRIMQTSFVQPHGAKEVSGREYAEGQGMYRSEVLPGNYAFVYTPPQDIISKVNVDSDTVNVMGKAMVMTFTELQMSVADRSERDVPVPSIADIGKLLDAISGILTIAEKSKQVETNFSSVQHVVDDAIRQISEKSLDSGAPSNRMIHMLGEISKKLAEPTGLYLHWLAVTLNIYLTFLSQCMTHYEHEGH